MFKHIAARWKTILLTSAIALVLTVGFGAMYFHDHAWGAWGDDSAGYIFLAGRMFAQQPSVYYDELAAKGFEFFQDEKLTRWLTPTHHSLINRHGVIASKYPVGLSILMVVAATIARSSYGLYIIMPLCGALNVGLVYVLAVILFSKQRYRHIVGILAGLFLGLTSLHYDQALSQPMREIPSITFLLVMSIFLILAYHAEHDPAKKIQKRLIYMIVAGFAFGWAMNVRETSLLLFPAVVALGVSMLWKKSRSHKKNIQEIVLYGAAFCLATVVALTPTIWNSVQLSKDKEVFKARDVSTVVVLPNIGHINTISIDNIFHSEGKFKPGKGSLAHYWDVLKDATPLPYFFVLVLIGLIALWKESRPKALYLLLWFLGILTIFSLWVNPYPRYILPLLPAYFLLGAYGFVVVLEHILPKLFHNRFLARSMGIVFCVTLVFAYQPVWATVRTNMQSDVLIDRSISHKDLDTLVALGTQLNQSEKPVLMFSGATQYGLSETFEAHTGVKTIRFPLDQKFGFDPQQVNQFIDEVRKSGYTLFVWVDETSSDEVLQWMEHYTAEPVTHLDLDVQLDEVPMLESGVRILKISAPLN